MRDDDPPMDARTEATDISLALRRFHTKHAYDGESPSHSSSYRSQAYKKTNDKSDKAVRKAPDEEEASAVNAVTGQTVNCFKCHGRHFQKECPYKDKIYKVSSKYCITCDVCGHFFDSLNALAIRETRRALE